MSRIFIFSDIHANFPALRAVMEDVGEYDIALCAGDMVGYYDQPNEVCYYIRGMRNVSVIRGNHDAYVTGAMTPNPNNIGAYKTEWMQYVLSASNTAWLGTLPPEIKLDVDSWSITLRHANPWDEERYVYPDSHALMDEISLEDQELLILGHTHYPLQRECGAGVLINPGSVGQPRDSDPRASYVVFDTRTGKVDFRRVVYDVAAYQKHLTKQGWSKTVVGILSRANH